jgi:hypothetical protein
MTLKKFSKNFILTIAVLLGLATLAPVLALAQTGGTASSSVSGAAKLTALETRAKERGDKEIDRRIGALGDLNIRVAAMQRVSDAFKQSLSTMVSTEIANLTALKTKIDADTDSATLKTDIKSITDSYRVFALVLPQGRMAAAADRVATIVTMMGTLGGKLQARIQAAAAGNDVTALNTLLADMGTKLNDAQTQAQAAITASATLQPDGGDKTKMAANDAALKQARADLVAAQKDIATAHKDAGNIIAGLAKMKANSNASSTPATTTP